MSEHNIKLIKLINFSTLSPNEIRKYSVCEVTAPETYDEDGLAVQGGLMDNRLGTLEPGQKCGTCGHPALRCPGHFGHVELAEPVLHIAFIEEIYKLLLLTCKHCSKLLINQDKLDEYIKLIDASLKTPTVYDRYKKEMIAIAKKTDICPHCDKPKLAIDYTKPTTFHEITESGGANRLLPAAIRDRLEKVSDDSLSLIGYDIESTRPEWFVLNVLPIPPLVVRPSITLESGIRSEDDLTHKIVDVLRVNQRVRESKESGTPPLIVQDLVDLLQYHVTTFFDNEVTGLPQAHHRSGRPLKTLSQRLKGKEGRFRGSLSGKRVDFSSRTVISPDPSLDISEVGVPLEVAKKLTIPEKVTEWNLERIKKLITNGPFIHPGANYVIRPDGVKIRLDFVADKQSIIDTLQPEFIVERHIANGDIAIFNRQPSLHRMSVMSHSIKVLPYRTFRLHPAVCPPYNADFDGDEMNLHIPQSEEARSEAKILMSVHDQILSPRYGGPIIGGIRDYLTAAYLLTSENTLLTKEEFTNLALVGKYNGKLPEPFVKTPVPMYKGIQLLSLFIPDNFNYVLTSKWSKGLKKIKYDDVVIKDGIIVSGIIDKASIGAEEPNTILHRIAKDYGTNHSRLFLNSLLSILKTYITNYGFTFGYNDLLLDSPSIKLVNNSIMKAYGSVNDMINSYKKETLQLTRGLSAADTLELLINQELAKARDEVGKIADKAFSETNSGVIMARTGARGSNLNLGQMTAALGQQSVRGKRILKGYTRRALSHYPIEDLSPDAKGFVKSNYRDGLNPTEFFFHSMGGREGLVDTAVRTQQSGYMQRRLVNALEHLKIEYDSTVRDPYHKIIQFVYGEDGIDPAKSDHGASVNVERLVQIEQLLHKSVKKLSELQIEKILSKYSSNINSKILQDLKNSLKTHNKLSPVSAENICKSVIQLVENATVEPGEAIGMIAAQSIGEPGTQMTLRTFHFAGVKERDVTLGLPRLMELVDARKQPKTPSMDVYVLPKFSKSNSKTVKIAQEILLTKVSHVVESIEIDYEKNDMIINLSQELLNKRNCTIDEVAESLVSTKRTVTKQESSNKIIVNAEITNIQTAYVLKTKVLSTKVKGIPEIERITVVKEDDEWLIQTTGSNLAKVLDIPGVDGDRTTTNNIFEIYNTLGIEATRKALINEILLTLDEQGLEVDIRHISLVADLMTSTGIIKQIGRHGIAGTKSSVLARAAFEITVPTLAHASIKGKREQELLRGVTENVIVGLTVPIGTGMVDLYMRR